MVDKARGYSINYLYVAIAYSGEIILIITSLIGAWLFAKIYGHNNTNTMAMMMLAPLSYAVVEMCRVPLAICCRIQRNMVLKAVMVVGVVFAAGVTVKSLTQLGEQMFHPRLIDVVNADEAMRVAQREQETFDKKLAEADDVVEQHTKALNAIDQRSMGFVAEMGKVQPPKCFPIRNTDRQGRVRTSLRCTNDLRGPIIEQNLKVTNSEREAVQQKLDDARRERASLDRKAVDQRVSDATKAHREAVLNSQLHSFTAMIYGKNPTEVADSEIHTFLRYFVFFPAVFASLASTLLALGSVTIIKTPKPRGVSADEPPVPLSDQAGQYVLGGLAEHIIRETTQAVHKSARAEVADAAARATASVKIA
ncbi:hypothetical protein [Bosea sp. LC85]|uniref:hypothetical protein n=1 Tax=Bosea sp. LC85 TaxID=1502851 RepID=UPI0006984EB7|nr:hypothetical protein [Bosea sp. LC85]